MPTSGTWKVPFRGKFGAYDCGGGGGGQGQRPGDEVGVVLARRVVPPFSVQSRQKDTRVAQPPKCHATRRRNVFAGGGDGATAFRR
jgi:hypothetical protein